MNPTEYRVKGSGKDVDEDITSLCGDWGKHLKDDAIRKIRNGTAIYFVQEDGQRTVVGVYQGSDGRYHLRTNPDETKKNNLDDLPDCD